MIKVSARSIGCFLVLFSLLWTKTSSAQLEFPEDKVSWKFTVEQNGDEATVIGEITMVKHWHIYAVYLPKGSFLIPTSVTLTPSAHFKTIGKLEEPKPIFEHDEMAGEDLLYHSNTIKLKQKIKILSEKDFTLKGKFVFQTCDDTHCLPPHEAEFSVKLKGAVSSVTDVSKFKQIKGDEATDDKGNLYVNVNNEWHMVPEGNSAAFYKKYLSLKLN